jgi:UPF0716 family protein affecting phage T7 exclusion
MRAIKFGYWVKIILTVLSSAMGLLLAEKKTCG